MPFSPFNRIGLLTFVFVAICTCSSNGNTSADNLVDGFALDIDEISLSNGYFHTCVLERRVGIDFGGALKCWGDNSRQQISSPPGIYKQVTSGHLFSCAITHDSSNIVCWGGDFTSSAVVEEPPKGYFTQVSAGESHACAIHRNKSIKCWGRNDFGESTPPLGQFVQVSAGRFSTCGIRPNGFVQCWGKNNSGQSSPPTGAQFKQISVGIKNHVCGITLEGSVQCWGNNSRGQADEKLGPYLQVSSGLSSTCALHLNHTVHCWGGKHPIQKTKLIDVTVTRSDGIDFLTSEKGDDYQYSRISLGKDHACAIDLEEKVHCWGSTAQRGAHIVPLGFYAWVKSNTL